MKKITGKVVSLVLALALVVTSFSGTFAFAAAKQATATVTLPKDTVYLANGGATATLKADLISKFTPKTAKLYDGADVTLFIRDVVMTSGSGIATLSNHVDNGVVDHAEIILKNKDVKGDITLAARYSGTDVAGETTYNATATLKVKVLESGLTVIGAVPTDAAETVKDGEYPAALGTLAKTDKSTVFGAIYTVGVSDNAIAKWTAATEIPVTDPVVTTKATEVGKYFVTASGNSSVKLVAGAAGVFKLTTEKVGKNEATPYASIGNVAVKATKVLGVPKDVPTTQKLSTARLDIATAVTKVENKVVAAAGQDTIYVWRGATFLGTDSAVSTGDNTTDAILVTGADIEFGAVAVTMQGGTVGTITGATGGSIEVQDGIVVAIKGVPTVTVTKGNIGKITGAATSATINGGKVGDVTGGTVVVTSNDEKVPTTVGAITASVSATIGQDEKAAVATGLVSSILVNIHGAKTTVAGIDSNYGASLAVNYTGYKGAATVPAKVKSDVQPIINIDATSEVTYAGAVTLPMLMVEGRVKFADNAKVAGITGFGTVEFVAGKFYSTAAISGVKMKAAGTFKVGDTLFTADAYQVYDGSFTPVGYTVEVVSGTKIDTFKVKSVDFYNITLGKTSDKILLGKKATYTASTYPSGTKLPAGATIKFAFDGNEDNFVFTDNKNGTATIEAKKYENVFASLNAGTVTARLYDEYDFEMYEYAPTTCAITIVEKPDYVSDTNNNFSVASGSTYQFKITSSTAPVFTLGTGGVFTVAPVSHVAGSNDYFYKITATGKVGAATGVFINGNKLLVATVKAPAFKSDTNKDFTVKGAYQFKITAPVTPTFTVGTAGIFKAEFVNKVGNDYFYKITSVGAVGKDAGIYVNGAKLLVAKVG